MGVVEGQLLAGKYRVERVLGQGGMGVVVAAHHVALDQVVAIKFLLPEALDNEDALARFEREARAAVKIQSEHVARVTDVGRLENNAPYMVMELLRGRDLATLLREQGPLPLSDVADYLLQAGEAIAEAHGLGIVHRDLKPANLFLTQRADGSSCVKVLDFGISKLTLPGGVEQGITQAASLLGSPLYMSPEQLASARDVDMQTDIWSLGVICFELLTRRHPFQAQTLPQLCMAIQLGVPISLRSYRSELPLEVEAMVSRCLSKDLGKRYATIAEFASDLVKFAPPHSRVSAERIERIARSSGFSASSTVLSASTGGGASDAPVAVNPTLAEFGRTKPGASSTRFRLGLGLAALLALGSAGTYAVSRRELPKLEPVLASAASALPLPIESARSALAAPSPAAPPPLVVPAASVEPVPSTRPAPPVAALIRAPVTLAKPVSAPSSSAAASAKAVASAAPSSSAKAEASAAPSSSAKPVTLGGRL
ncbi:MAG TPA: serine/threonine-protein kinase [Polyangiaceae bacterium]|nr:serine/threonine-protein kinase [Polyangiaceae bacterium]